MRKLTILAAMPIALGMLAGPALAHNLEVNPPGNDKEIQGWVGGPILPIEAQGQGLYPAPPFAPGHKQPASHGNGLNVSCDSTESNPVVTIYGPPSPAGCEHGT